MPRLCSRQPTEESRLGPYQAGPPSRRNFTQPWAGSPRSGGATGEESGRGPSRREGGPPEAPPPLSLRGKAHGGGPTGRGEEEARP